MLEGLHQPRLLPEPPDDHPRQPAPENPDPDMTVLRLAAAVPRQSAASRLRVVIVPAHQAHIRLCVRWQEAEPESDPSRLTVPALNPKSLAGTGQTVSLKHSLQRRLDAL
jgi:hypothetical protein